MTRLVLFALLVCPVAAGCGRSAANDAATPLPRPAPKVKAAPAAQKKYAGKTRTPPGVGQTFSRQLD